MEDGVWVTGNRRWETPQTFPIFLCPLRPCLFPFYSIPLLFYSPHPFTFSTSLHFQLLHFYFLRVSPASLPPVSSHLPVFTGIIARIQLAGI